MQEFLSGKVAVHLGDCMDVMATLPAESVHSVCSDPPYHLLSTVERFAKSGGSDRIHNGDDQYGRLSRGFMGKAWDGGDIAFKPETWAAAMRVLKPGGHLVAFGAPKNYHRLAVAIEDAGFEIRDSLMWLFGTGFPKSHDVSKGIDRAAGAEREVIGRKTGRGATPVSDMRGGKMHAGGTTAGTFDASAIYAPATPEAAEWEGWGTALKPAFEPIVLARKPLSEGTVAANALRWRTGALNIGVCRVEGAGGGTRCSRRDENGKCLGHPDRRGTAFGLTYHGTESDSDGRFPANVVHDGSDEVVGSAARFFYSAKADGDDRLGSGHPTVKPVDLMRWLVRLITPPGGVVLDPFAGTGTTGEAAFLEGFRAILIEREEEYVADIERRMRLALSGPDERTRETIKAKNLPMDAGPLFGGT